MDEDAENGFFSQLQIACFRGNLDAVTFLIQNGADIEVATIDGRTNLMIACSRSHFQIVQYLLAWGANVNRKTVEGRTALHDCAQSGNVEVLKMVLNHNAKFEPDSYGTTPLHYAAISGNAAVLEYFIQNLPLPYLDRINALELMGAANIDTRRNFYSGLACWTFAMSMRYEDPKCLWLKTNSELRFGEQWAEVKSPAQLEELRSDQNELQIQAFLVRKRIMGLTNPHTCNALLSLATLWITNGNFIKVIYLYTNSLDVLCNLVNPVGKMTQVILIQLVDVLNRISVEAEAHDGNPSVPFRQLLDAYEKSIKVLKSAMEKTCFKTGCHCISSDFHRTLCIVLHLMGVLCEFVPDIPYSETLEFEKIVYRFVHMNPRGKKDCTPLHLACSKDTCIGVCDVTCAFPSTMLTELLLLVGANPNAVDADNNTPLHLLALIEPCPMDAFKMLLSHGAHLDVSNIHKIRPLESIQNTPMAEMFYPLKYLKLQCLCAQVIRSHNLPYKGLVQKNLEQFVDIH